jgi:hypothetical protein
MYDCVALHNQYAARRNSFLHPLAIHLLHNFVVVLKHDTISAG